MTLTDNKLDKQIHQFINRKTRQFPELERIAPKDGRHDLLTRVQEVVNAATHAAQPKHQ